MLNVLNEQDIDREIDNRFAAMLMDMPKAHAWVRSRTKDYLLNLAGSERDEIFVVYDEGSVPPLVLPPDFVLPSWAEEMMREKQPVYVFDYWNFKPGHCSVWRMMQRIPLWFRSQPPPKIDFDSLSFDEAAERAKHWESEVLGDENGVG